MGSEQKWWHQRLSPSLGLYGCPVLVNRLEISHLQRKSTLRPSIPLNALQRRSRKGSEQAFAALHPDGRLGSKAAKQLFEI